MFDLEERYWWFVGRRHILYNLLKQKGHIPPNALILDVGCGAGGTLSLLQEFGHVIGIDVFLDALNLCKNRGHRLLVLADGSHAPFRDESFDCISVLDVLEHIEDDHSALAEVRRLLRPWGKAIVTVPAYPSLWSEHDEALHHRRRYRFADFKEKVEAAGLEINKMTFAISAVLGPVFLFRWLQRLVKRRPNATAKTALIQLPPLLNGLLIVYLRLEASIIPRCNLPFGVSILCLAQKTPPLTGGGETYQS